MPIKIQDKSLLDQLLDRAAKLKDKKFHLSLAEISVLNFADTQNDYMNRYRDINKNQNGKSQVSLFVEQDMATHLQSLLGFSKGPSSANWSRIDEAMFVTEVVDASAPTDIRAWFQEDPVQRKILILVIFTQGGLNKSSFSMLRVFHSNVEMTQFFSSLISRGQEISQSDAELLLQRASQQSQLYTSIENLSVYLPVISWSNYVSLAQKSESFEKQLTPFQVQAIQTQTSLGNQESQKINRQLRTGLVEPWSQAFSIPEIVDAVDSVVCDPRLPTLNEPIFVQRGIRGDESIEPTEDRGQKSTTLNPRVALSFCGGLDPIVPQCILLQIALPPGYPIFRVSLSETRFAESEILLSRGTKFAFQKGSFNIVSPDKAIQIIRVTAQQNCEPNISL